jgi:hypothetical protein
LIESSSTTSTRRGVDRRKGITVLVPFLFVVLIGLFVYIGAVSLSTSTAARTTYRVADLRMAAEACQSVLQSTVQQFRSDKTFQNANFRPPFAENGPFPKKDYPIDAWLLQQMVDQMGVSLDPAVHLAVVEWHNSPSYDRNIAKRGDPYPQGIIELTVSVRSTRATFQTERKFIQRRVFWLSFSDKANLNAITLANATPEDVEFFIGSAPLATMIAGGS